MYDVVTTEVVFALAVHYPADTVAFDPSGKWMASGHYDAFRLWDASSGKLLRTIEDTGGTALSACILPRSAPNCVALTTPWGGDPQPVFILDTASGDLHQQLATSIVHPNPWSRFEADARGKILAARARGGVQLWDMEAGKLTQTICFENQAPVGEWCLSADGRYLAANASPVGKTNKLWHVDPKKDTFHLWLVDLEKDTRRCLGTNSSEFGLWFNELAGALVAMASEKVSVWSVSDGSLLRAFDVFGEDNKAQGYYIAEHSLDGNYLAAIDKQRMAIELWDVRSGTRLFRGSDTNEFIRIEFSPNGDALASYQQSGQDDIKVWEVRTGRLLLTLGPDLHVGKVIFNPKGHEVIAVSRPATPATSACVWPIESGQLLRTIRWHGPDHTLSHAAVTPEGDYLLIAQNDLVHMWRLDTGEEVRQFTASGSSTIRSISITSDSKTLVGTSDDGGAWLWNLATGELKRAFATFEGGEWIAYHPQKTVYSSSPRGDEYAASSLEAKRGQSIR